MKKLICLLVVSILLVALAGCATNSSDVKETNTSTDKATAVVADTAQTTEPVITQITEPVKLEFFQTKVEAVDTFQAIIDEFHKSHPNITVEQTNVQDSAQVIMTRMASGDAPDLFLHYPHNADFRAFCENGYVQDLTDEDFINNIKDDIKDMLINLQGKVYVVPISTNAYGVLYNEKEFQSLGLEIPKTYNEFVDMLKVIKEAEKTAIVFGDKSAGLIDQFARSMYPSYIQDYESFFNKIANEEKFLRQQVLN